MHKREVKKITHKEEGDEINISSERKAVNERKMMKEENIEEKETIEENMMRKYI